MIFLVSFLLFVIAVLLMSIGLFFQRHPIQGSCGGLNNIKGLSEACGACGKTCKKRKKLNTNNTTRYTR